jgi:steroid 5-alpha reductase family enzyme
VLGTAVVFAGPGSVLAYAAGGVAVLMLALWAISVQISDVSIVDPAWGPAFVVVAVIAALAGSGDSGRRWLVAGATAAWGLRLGLHLTRRKLAEPEEDRRYARMRKAKGGSFTLWSLYMIFGVQGLLVLVVSLPITVAAGRSAALDAGAIPGAAVFLIGLGFEAIGDDQLRRFKADPANRGQVMNRGLWRYTRHPNYFGDACLWWGLWAIALPAGGTWWTAIGPATMTFLLVRVSGKAMLERDIGKRRPGYAEYIRRTSGFFPLPPRQPQSGEGD